MLCVCVCIYTCVYVNIYMYICMFPELWVMSSEEQSPVFYSVQKFLLVEPVISVSLCHHRKYHRLGVLNNRHLFVTVLEAGNPKSEWQHGQVLMWAFFLACRRPPSHCIVTGNKENSAVFSPTETSSLTSGPHPPDLINLNHFLEALFTMQSYKGLGFQHMNGGSTIQSMATKIYSLT